MPGKEWKLMTDMNVSEASLLSFKQETKDYRMISTQYCLLLQMKFLYKSLPFYIAMWGWSKGIFLWKTILMSSSELSWPLAEAVCGHQSVPHVRSNWQLLWYQAHELCHTHQQSLELLLTQFRQMMSSTLITCGKNDAISLSNKTLFHLTDKFVVSLELLWSAWVATAFSSLYILSNLASISSSLWQCFLMQDIYSQILADIFPLL